MQKPASCCAYKSPATSPSADSCASATALSSGSAAAIAIDINDAPPASHYYQWKIAGMDCPGCARKIENALTALPGIRQVRVLFATEKLLAETENDIRDQIERTVTAAGFRLLSSENDEPKHPGSSANFWRENGLLISVAALLLLSELLSWLSPPAGRTAFIATTLAGLWPVGRKAWRAIRSGTPFAIETLMTIAATGALFIGANAEAAMVLLLFLLGERLEIFAAGRARRGVTALMALKPEVATRLRNGQRETVPVGELQPGDIIEVAPGARLPADAQLLSPQASFDESAMTGEAIPAEHQQGDSVAAGCISVGRLVQMTVLSRPGESAIDRILHLIEESEAQRAPVERFIDRFSRFYTPAILLVALLVALIPPLFFAAAWLPQIYKGLTLLLIGCPCALVISTPAAITSALACAARQGLLIKGGATLENLGKIRTFAFDKTGTLTAGKPQVTEIIALAGYDDEQLLRLAAAAEQGSTHPLAQAIVALAQQRQLVLPTVQAQRNLPGRGIEAQVAGHTLLLAAPHQLSLTDKSLTEHIAQLEATGKTVVVISEAARPLGLIALRDTLRPDAGETVAQLQSLKVQSVMLTGDNPRAAAAIARELNIDWRAGLLPAGKVEIVNQLNQRASVAMVGDGINDAPAMKAASIGIAMGTGTDVTLETADAALTHNRLSGLVTMVRLSRAARINIRQNIAIALGLKGLFFVTTLAGITGLWPAVLADTGATVLVTANALRLLRRG